MSILIKGMEMPIMPETIKQAENVPYIDVRIFADGTAVTSKGEKPYYTEYSVVELPPHGRLIDADAQIERAKRLNLSTAGIIKTLLDTAPTIIKAEEGEE